MRFIIFIMSFFFITSAFASEEKNGLDAIMDGFDTGPDFTAENINPVIKNKKFRAYAEMELLASIHLKNNETASYNQKSLRTERLNLDFDINFESKNDYFHFFTDFELSHDFAPHLNSDRSYNSRSYSDSVEREFELKELWIEKNMSSYCDLKIGRQIVSWGASDTFRVADVLNPVDNKSFGMTDVEDIRLPVFMTRLNLYSKKADLSLIAVHENREDETPNFGSPYYTGSKNTMPTKKDSSSIEDTKFALSLKGHFRNFDAGFYFADYFGTSSYIDTQNKINKYSDPLMTGFDLAIPYKDCLLKFESAFFKNVHYLGSHNPKSRFDFLGGIEYSGIKDTDIVVELVNRHIFSFEDEMEKFGYDDNQFSSVLRISRNFFNERLNLCLVSSFLGFDFKDGGFTRFVSEYEYSDNIKIESGCVFYFTGDKKFYKNLHDNDIVFVKVCINLDFI